MEGKALISITSDEYGEVNLSVEFFPPMKKDETNPESHIVAIDMLESAVLNSNDPEEAFSSARFRK